MKYSIFQIIFSDKEYNEINGMRDPRADHPKYKAHTGAMFEEFEGAKGYYTKVAEIEANDLEHVFQIGNIGPEDKITRLKRMHSISVGDVIVTGTGEQYGVEGFGFKEVEGIV